MKKVVFIGPLPPPLGGVAMINQSFQSLELEGYDTINFDTSNKYLTEDLYKGMPWNNIGKEYSKIKKLKHFLINSKPDMANVFVTSGYSIIRDIFYLRMLYKQNIPVIIHFHSKTTGEFALTHKRLNWVSKYFNKYANRIILLSEQHYEFFINYFGQEKCEVIENFVDYSDFENEIKSKNEDFLFVGRLSKEKGFFDLLHAVNSLKEKNILFRIQVIGVAPTKEVEMEINDLINSLQLTDYFVFNGATFGETKHTLFKKSRCLIFPSHFENSSVVLKEAIAAKLAIIASDIGANRLILNGRDNYELHEVKNVLNLAKTIENLLQHSEKIDAYCKASELIDEYDKSFAEKKLLTLMNTICQEKLIF